jgi:hypothetical protein
LRPLQPAAGAPLDKLVTFAPPDAVDRLLDAMAAAGAGRIGDYDRCAFLAEGVGTFRPGASAEPAIGSPGVVERTPEVRIEMVVPRGQRASVVRALLATHPYEEPAWDVVELAARPAGSGLGRVGVLPEATTLQGFVRRMAAALPATAWGVRAAGDPQRPVRTVAVCGGSGGSLAADAARAGADVLLTADLRHHVASEAIEDDMVALVDAAHWATEAPWLAAVAARLRDHYGASVDVRVSETVTDPWTLHAPSPESSPTST